ncbi:uncharacterized protein EDB91DRAFT_1241499 [Suillus paluster]|uniref:uncharacterized protein n=1 Tax=Suillus paluster TaxID=48578 RepID=UPI001B85F0C1|nr:uncharacterized protein EDB91DRAFT_1241499 [Suillus paluster]KAG1756427.1 hypothetical protein EDB91DRAFT_1241499 [Suillus paluster]
MRTIYYGPVINPQSVTDYLALPQCLICVSPQGDIEWVHEDVESSKLQDVLAEHNYAPSDFTLCQLDDGDFLMPGLIDTHAHACQVPNLGVGGEMELLQWLDNYTFPTEARFKDVGYATRAYTDVVRRMVNSGTTTCCYYGSLHLEATKVLATLIHTAGQRAFVGKCNMNWNCPPNYIEPSVKESVDTTLKLFKHIEELPRTTCGEPLVHPILTPRFAISCTEELLTRLSQIAKENPKLAIQTHISENKAEVELTKSLFKTNSYAEAYDKFGLLRDNTVLAHGVYLTEDEMVLIAKRGSGVSHCPTSNFYLSSGMARVGMLLDHGVKVGLGTDVAGGYSPSILTEIQHASIASKMLAIQATPDTKCNCSRGHHRHQTDASSYSSVESDSQSRGHSHKSNECDCDKKPSGRFTNQKLSIATLLYLATLGGAHVCCLEDRVGSFEEGKAFDALLVTVQDAAGNPAVWGYNPQRDLTQGVTAQSADKNLIEWLERFLFCGDDRNIKKVIVQGKTIGGRDHQ